MARHSRNRRPQRRRGEGQPRGTPRLSTTARAIDRAVRLWSNPGELVFSPFGGIGSEGWAALSADRQFYGVELKESYYRTAVKNLRKKEHSIGSKMSLFDEVPA